MATRKRNDGDDQAEKKKPRLESPDVFAFYSKSSAAPPPGQGAKEKYNAAAQREYPGLKKDWRKRLSNFHVPEVPFMWDGCLWASVEHAYQAHKFWKNNRDFALRFSHISCGLSVVRTRITPLTSPALAKAMGGKSGKYRGDLVRPVEVKIDHDFFTTDRHKDVMFQAMLAKFTQDPESRETLLATGDAVLTHIVSRSSTPVVFENLMRVRSMLRK